MCKNKNAKIIIFLCVFFLGILIFENCRVGKILSEKQKKLHLIEESSKNKCIPDNKFGYSDIIKYFSNEDGLKTIKFIKLRENNIASVEVDIYGDIAFAQKELKIIESRENFQKVNSIKVGKDKDGKIITKVNMDFISNK